LTASHQEVKEAVLEPLLGLTARQWAQALRAAVLVVFAAAWLATLAARPLYKPDEARNGEIAREMAVSGDWVTPRLNGFKYFEKPPLQYWASALAVSVLGPTDFAARLWTGLLAILGVGLAFAAGRRLFGAGAGALSAGVLAGCPLYLLLGQVNTLDIGVSVFLSAAVFAFVIAQDERTHAHSRRRWMIACWAACALAVLSKGLIGIALPAASLGLYVLLRRDWRLLRRLEPTRGAGVFLAITAPWFVVVSLRNPEFAHFFFVQEHWLRFTTTMHRRVHPAWYFVPVFAAGAAPWLFAILAGWASALRRLRHAAFSPGLFLALWALVVFVFFSLSGSKLPPYILPMFPALAVLAGRYLAGAPARGFLTAQCLLLAGAGLVLGSGALDARLAASATVGPLSADFLPWLAAASVVLVASGALGAAAASAKLRETALAFITGGTLAASLLCLAGHRVFAPAYSVASLAAAVPAGASVYAVEAYDHTMPWSLRRTVTMVGHKDELAVSLRWERGSFIADLDHFRRAWSAEREAYAFFAVRDFDRLRRELDLPMEEIARGPRYVLVRKP
jgi:4-amino-4-deoxy-L-arabinose transferase-like glycosyltransferase